MTPLERYAHEMVGWRLPPGPKAMCRLADGRWAVKAELDGDKGYLLVDASFRGTGGVVFTLEDLAKRGLAPNSAFSVRNVT